MYRLSHRKKYIAPAVFVFSALVYCSVLVPPEKFWPAALLAYAIPVFLIIHLAMLVWLSFRKSSLVIWPLLGLLSGWYFVKISMHYSREEFDHAKSNDLEILSFNAKLFRKPHTYEKFSFDMIEWLVQDSADVKCIQEYSTNARWDVLDVTRQVEATGYYDYTRDYPLPMAEHQPGLAIFSKYPIVNKGEIVFDEKTVNNVIFADIVLDDDTVRIYNVHLSSMNIPLYAYTTVQHVGDKLHMLLAKLKNGAVIRSKEIDRLTAHVDTCPYPFIICGDFNEIPYGYNYLKLRKRFSNTFEHSGHGFGFSLNSKLFFLRIDHQFYGNGMVPLYFRVDRSMALSDHFPLRGIYRCHGQ